MKIVYCDFQKFRLGLSDNKILAVLVGMISDELYLA